MSEMTSQHRLSRIEHGRQQWSANWRRLHQGWQIFAQNRIALTGLVLLIVFAAFPIIYRALRATAWESAKIYDPVVGFDVEAAPHPAPPSWIPPDLLPADSTHRFDDNRPSFTHLLGTDTLGRDVLSVVMASTVNSFIVGLTSALTTAVVGLVIAAMSAYYRSWVDGIFSHISDAFLLLPPPIFMIAISIFLYTQKITFLEIVYQQITGNGFSDELKIVVQPLEFGIIYGVIAGAGGAAIVLRSHGLKVMNLSFVEASRVTGAGARHIIWRHLIPHMMPLAAVYMMVIVTGAVVADGFVAFFGFNPNPLNWGTMIYNAFVYRNLNYVIPWMALMAPAMAISLFAATFYMISRGLLQVIDPRLRHEHGGVRP